MQEEDKGTSAEAAPADSANAAKSSPSGSDAMRSFIACFMPTSGGWFFLWFLSMFIFFAPRSILFDGAVARHCNTGSHILLTRQIPDTNYVWAIDPNHPWFPLGVFGDIAIGASYLMGGLNGVVLLGFLVVGAVLMWSYQIGREQGLGRISGWLLFIPMLLAHSVHWLTRAHIFSYVFFLWIYYIHYVRETPFVRKLILTFIIMVLWCNFHGSIFIGLFTLALPVAVKILSTLWNGTLPEQKKPIMQDLIVLAAAALGLGINIKGLGNYGYLISYLTHPEILGKGSEWTSFDFAMGIGAWAYLILFFMVLTIWSYSPKRPNLAQFGLCTAMFFAGIYVMRLMPYFAMIALPCVAPSMLALRQEFAKGEGSSILQRSVRKLFQIDQNIAIKTSDLLKQSIIKIVFLLVVASVFILNPKFAVNDFPPEKLPVAATDYIKEHKIGGLGFTLDNWGPYIHFKFKTPVFIDEKTDFYPQEFLDEYHAALSGKAPDVLDKYKTTYVLVPPGVGLCAVLDKSNDWQQVYKDKIAVVYIRKVTAAQ